MRHASPKRDKENRLYLHLRAGYIEEHPDCEARAPGCTGRTEQIQHKRGRVGADLNDMTLWLAVCAACQGYITLHPAEAYLRGWAVRRIGRGE
ncbi:MAG: hypothetical protein ACSLE9_08065 [Burkholderiaceae bacterium]